MMDVVYWSGYDAATEELTFHALLNAQIEMSTVGTVVNLLFGFYDQAGDMWDWLKCEVAYDGDVNTVARYYSVHDLYSRGPDTPGKMGIAELLDDKQQDWVIDEENSKSTCPYLQKCVFQCGASRSFVTNDSDDFDFSS